MTLYKPSDLYPYVSNIGYYNGIINMLTSVTTPQEVKINGVSMMDSQLDEIAEALRTQFKHHHDMVFVN